MPHLTRPDGYPFQNLITEVSPADTMFAGSSEHYLHVGLSALSVIEVSLLGAPAPQTILDLPCGYGRVTRVLRACYPLASITACDLDRAGVDFAAATFDARGVYSEPNFRDLNFGQTFDLIWVGSLLTHLPEHQTRQFFDFAARHMGPESRLVVTSHGDYVATRLRSWDYGLGEPAARGLLGQWLADGYGYRGYGGNPAYGISLVSHQWYEALFTDSPLSLQSYQERGWDSHQDTLVVRRTPDPEARFGLPWFERPDMATPLPAEEQAAADEAGVPGFSEGWYCNTFADVAAAVRNGAFPSGLAHFLEYGWKEGRPPFDPQLSYTQRPSPSA